MATQFYTKLAGEKLVAGVDFSDRLIDGDLLTGTPTAVAAPSGPTISAVARNTVAVTILGASVVANKAVLFTIAAGTPETTYVVTVTALTVSGQELVERCSVRVEA